MFDQVAQGVKDAKFHSLFKSTFVATNPTPETGIASTDDTVAFSATAGLMNIYNGATNAQGNWIRPLHLKLRATAVNTSASDFQIQFNRDIINRWSSGGSAITEVSSFGNTDISDTTLPTSKATIYFGALVLAAASSSVLLGHEIVSDTIFAANDQINIIFDYGPEAGYNVDAVEVSNFYIGPMAIGPGHNLSLHAWGNSMAADPAFEFRLVYAEYPNQN